MLEETFQTGAAILTNMAGQRERLKVRCSLGPCWATTYSLAGKGIILVQPVLR